MTTIDKINQQIADEIQANSTAFIMTSKVNGRVVLRFSICSHRTTLGDIETVFKKLQSIGEAIDKTNVD